MNTIKIENRNELIGFLRAIGTECRFVTVDTETLVQMNQGRLTGRKIRSPKTGKPINEKEPNPYYGTIKVARRNGFVNANFVTAVIKRYCELNKVNPADVDYTPGETWYQHCHSENGKPLCLCEHQDNPERKYMQIFPLRNLGETKYVHPTLGQLNRDQIRDMYENWVTEREEVEWKPRVIVLAVDSIRSCTFRQIRLLNDTFSRLAGRLARFKGMTASTDPLPVVAAE